HAFPPRRSSDLKKAPYGSAIAPSLRGRAASRQRRSRRSAGGNRSVRCQKRLRIATRRERTGCPFRIVPSPRRQGYGKEARIDRAIHATLEEMAAGQGAGDAAVCAKPAGRKSRAELPPARRQTASPSLRRLRYLPRRSAPSGDKTRSTIAAQSSRPGQFGFNSRKKPAHLRQI